MKQVVSPPPVIPKPRPSNPTLLELAIHRFEHQARVYHHKKAQIAVASGCKEQIAAQRADLDRDWQHLQRERIRISMQAQLQVGLEEYRSNAKAKTVAELAKEPHHPTTQLTRNLTAIGDPKPSPDHDPHHIIMGKGRWQPLEMVKARLALHMHKIGINDPINGVWLPRKKADKGHWATPLAPSHKEIHSYNYETWISRHFGARNLNEAQLRLKLRDIKYQLENGGYALEITAPKDAKWNGA